MLFTKTFFVVSALTLILANGETASEIDCIVTDTRYDPLNMPGQGRSVEDSAISCRNRCLNTKGCSYFSWWSAKDDGGCHLQGPSAVAISAPGVVAGPKSCTSDLCGPPSNDADPRVVSYGMHCKGSCINGNIGYTSLSKAWKKCFEVRHCAFIMRYSDERYYLRRASDNYADGFKGYLHSCDSRDCVEKSNPKSRIGGPDACEVIPHSKPWIAWIEHCGGTLIGSQYVLTAAHCVCKDYYDCNEFIVDYAILGDHDINVVDDGEMKITIAGIIVHPDYKSGKNHNADYAILVLAWPVKTNDRIKIAKLPEKGAKCPPGNNMVVSGWGADTKHELTDKLWSVLQTCLPDEYCPNVEHDRYTLCAGSLKNNANTICGGDSGGPLTYTDYKTGETTLYGVVAQYGDYPNCRKPGVYAPVSEPSVLDWIRTHTDAV